MMGICEGEESDFGISRGGERGRKEENMDGKKTYRHKDVGREASVRKREPAAQRELPSLGYEELCDGKRDRKLSPPVGDICRPSTLTESDFFYPATGPCGHMRSFPCYHNVQGQPALSASHNTMLSALNKSDRGIVAARGKEDLLSVQFLVVARHAHSEERYRYLVRQ